MYDRIYIRKWITDLPYDAGSVECNRPWNQTYLIVRHNHPIFFQHICLLIISKSSYDWPMFSVFRMGHES